MNLDLGAAYDAVAYPGFVYPQTHPDRLATQATLFGMHPAPVDGCRVLEIGCGDGGNLVPMALTLPASEFVGIDLAREPIERGVALAAELGAGNVTLHAADVQDLPADLGRFDYIVSHGVYSWVPPLPRDALLAACRTHLAPEGVAYVSYNAYPGSYLRDMARDMMRFHVTHIEDPGERVAQARGLMELIVGAGADTPYAKVLRDHMERLLAHRDWALFHDDLAEVNTPVYFHEFMDHAGAHGLQFLAEAELSASRLPEVPDTVADALARLPEDILVREQYLDFVRNRMFRQTLICHSEVPLVRTVPLAVLDRLWIASPVRVADAEPGPGGEVSFTGPHRSAIQTADPLLIGTLRALGEAWPRALTLDALLTAAGGHATEDRDRLAEVLLRAAAGAVVELHTHPPPVVSVPGARPLASRFARRQAAAGESIVSTLRHDSVRLEDPLAAFLLTCLDGTRDRTALVAAVRDFADTGGLAATPDVSVPLDADLPAALEVALAQLARLGLLAPVD